MLERRKAQELLTSEANVKLADIYHQWFEVIPARDETLKDQVYRLRYQVYCRENNFEDPNEHKRGREMDGFDHRSVHSLLIDRAQMAAIGTVRLILPDHHAPNKSFPIQNVCNHHLLSDRQLLLTSKVAEISRFSISKEFKKYTDNADIDMSQASNSRDDYLIARRMITPCITLGLMKAIMQMSVENGVTDLFAIMEPSLIRLLARFSIYFRPIGPLVDFHGMRQPCHAKIETLLSKVRKERTDVWEIITDYGTLLREMRQKVYYC